MTELKILWTSSSSRGPRGIRDWMRVMIFGGVKEKNKKKRKRKRRRRRRHDY